MNFDFMAAKLKHTMWKLHLREFLDGKPGLTPEQATSHRDCELGRWLYAEGLARYGAVPEMKLLVSEHEQLHQLVKQVVELKSAGRKADAEAAFKQLDPISRRLLDHLATVEKAVAARA